MEGKIIKGFSNYTVYSDGNIYSNGFRTKDKNGRNWTKLPRLLKGSKSSNGYISVKLISDNGSKKVFYVHRLVAEYYIENTNNYPFVNHIDGNPSNNNYNNLEWCTQNMNMDHSYYVLKKVGFKNRPIKQLTLNGQLIKIWPSVNRAYKDLGYTSTSPIWQVLQGKTKTYKGHIWQYH